jgi:hypothetical protein
MKVTPRYVLNRRLYGPQSRYALYGEETNRFSLPGIEPQASIPLSSHYTNMAIGRAIAQAVSRRLPTAAARVQTRVWSCGIL